jgi:hypothetical protein
MQANVQAVYGIVVTHNTMPYPSSWAHRKRDQLRPIILLWDGRNVLRGAENESALDGKQSAEINYAKCPVKLFELLQQIGTLRIRSEKVSDSISLFREQNTTTCIAFALSQSLLRPLQLPRKLLLPQAYRGATVRILIKPPRYQFMHVYLCVIQGSTSTV